MNKKFHALVYLPVFLFLVVGVSACSLFPFHSPTTGDFFLSSTCSGNILNAPINIERDSSGSTIVVASIVFNTANGGQQSFPFIVDTGASTSLLETTTAAKLELTPTGNVQRVAGITGGENTVSVALSNWSIDGIIPLPSVFVQTPYNPSFSRLRGVTDMQGNAIAGLLGSDVLSHFGPIMINYGSAPNGTISQGNIAVCHTPV